MWSKGFCKFHQYLRTDKKPKGLNKVSDKRLEENEEYKKVRAQYLAEHPTCEVHGCSNKASDIHHKMHIRAGSLLNDVTQFMATCRTCHQKIHNSPTWAVAEGYLADSKTKADYFKVKINTK